MPKLIKVKNIDANPFYVLERDGVTFSLMSTFRDCRWKARNYMRGLTSMSAGLPIIFGNIVHAALEQGYRGQRDGEYSGVMPTPLISRTLDGLEQAFRADHPRMKPQTASDLELTMLLATQVMPQYFSHWYGIDKKIKWLETEREFRLPWTVVLPPHRINGKWIEREVKTFLRGKVDGLFDLPADDGVGVLETKTKGRVDPGNIMSMLSYNLQVSIYALCAEILYKRTPRQVLYNIVRRPQLRQKVSETLPQFATRVGEDIAERPDFYFMRMKLSMDDNDLVRMRANVDETMTDFVMWWLGMTGHYPNDGHCENKYGACEYLEWCGGGNRDLYTVRPKMFPELEES